MLEYLSPASVLLRQYFGRPDLPVVAFRRGHVEDDGGYRILAAVGHAEALCEVV